MVETKYYIEDLIEGLVLQNDGTWDWFAGVNEKTFTSNAAAVTHIDTLDDGEYKVFNRIIKS